MLDEYYLREKPLPLDRKLLYARVRANTEEERWAVDSILVEFFRETKRGFYNKRGEEEIRNANLRAKSAQNNGLRGGRPKTHPVPVRLPSANPIESSLDSRLKTLDLRQKKETDTEAFARKSFERFWQPYPQHRQVARDVCWQLWLMLGSIEQDRAAESVPGFLHSEGWAETRYVPNAEKFIRDRMWNAKPVAGGKSVTKTAVERLRTEIVNSGVDRQT